MLDLFDVAGIYAAIVGVLLVVFTLRVGMYRLKSRISFGDEGDKELLRRMRAHGNFVESTPIALILLLLVDASGAANWLVHIIGLTLVVGRLSHWLQLSGFLKPFVFRMMGMLLTFFSLLASSGWLLYSAF